MISPTEKLLAIEDIKKLKARYFRFFDAKDWAGFRSLFEDDAVFASPVPPRANAAEDLFERAEDIVGADAFIEWARRSSETAHTAHKGYNAEIEILSATEATGLWGMEDVLHWPNRRMNGHGYYRESYACRDGVWRIKKWALFYKTIEIHDVATTGGPIV